MRNPKLYLRDIIDAISAIERFVEGADFEDFKKNDEKSSAVIRKFEIIGEAAKNVPENIKQAYPDIPWREIAGFRDILIHAYFGIKYEIIWRTIKNRIPQVKSSVQKVLKNLENK